MTAAGPFLSRITRAMLEGLLGRFTRLTPMMMEALVLQRFYQDEVGRAYGVDRRAKTAMAERFQTVTRDVPSGTTWLYHVVLATELLRIPPSVVGDVVECGCWKGASTASLSTVCAAVGRRLIVCDSFEGLPEDEQQKTHQYPHVGVFGYYQKGMYAGRLEEVQATISKYGRLDVCQFVTGFFSDSLTSLTRPVVFAFLDVDLAPSMKDCVQYLWPLLVDGGLIYTDDSCDMEVVRIWFDEAWWKETLGCRPPGYVGSGCGLPIHPEFSSIGYARKVSVPERYYHRVSWLAYPDSEPAGEPFTRKTT